MTNRKKIVDIVIISYTLSLGIKIFNLEKFEFTIDCHLTNIHFLGKSNVRWAFRGICKYDPIRLHTVLHYLSDLLLLQHGTYILKLKLLYFQIIFRLLDNFENDKRCDFKKCCKTCNLRIQ